MTDDQEKTPTFQTLGNADASAVCGPDGCNINQHRQAEQKEKSDR